ncbi:hypothetical protein MG295_00135 [Bacillus phage vB_BcgM]|nr:hypothetical protein MG295_00135 [Bacillus phage vB_BcgM]
MDLQSFGYEEEDWIGRECYLPNYLLGFEVEGAMYTTCRVAYIDEITETVYVLYTHPDDVGGEEGTTTQRYAYIPKDVFAQNAMWI